MAAKAWITLLPVLAGLAAATGYEAGYGQWRTMPAFQVQAAGLYPGATDFRFQRNDLGLRGSETAAGTSIITVGGASTEQPYLPDALTWQSLLADLLRQDGRPVQIGNGGRLGSNLADHARQVQQWAGRADFRPKFALILLEDPGAAPHPPERRSPKSRSALYGRLFGPHVDFPAMTAQAGTDPGPLPADAAERIHQLAQSILLWGAVPVFVTVPGADRVNALALKQCRRDDLLCLDAATDIRWQPEDRLPGGGFSPSGAAKMARWLFSKLAILV